MKHIAVPIFATIIVNDDSEIAAKKKAIEELLRHDMLRFALASDGVELVSTFVGDPYACEPPKG
jgi:hypothetical protein